ncbi:hypothetical protein SLA2020_097710 [Shorea laevis]
MATRILSLTSSASECERKWSCFEGIHTKKKNKLEASRFNDLVFIQLNAKLSNKKKRPSGNRDILLASDVTNAQGWLVENGDISEEYDLFLGTNIPFTVVAKASRVDSVLERKRSTKSRFTTPLMRELNEELDESSNERN